MYRAKLPRYFLLIVVLILITGAITCFFLKDSLQKKTIQKESIAPPTASTAKTNTETRPVPAKKAEPEPQLNKTPLQQMHETVDCAALLAAHESSTKGELKAESTTFNIISYTLGKAQELALQAGLNKDAAKQRYDEQVVSNFLEYTANPETVAQKNTAKVADCEKQLRAFEPNGLIQSTIEKARAMAREKQQ